jgi:hypothetical protein
MEEWIVIFSTVPGRVKRFDLDLGNLEISPPFRVGLIGDAIALIEFAHVAFC